MSIRWTVSYLVIFSVLFALPALAEEGSEKAIAFKQPPIQVPEGYVVELVAAPPLVKHPMMAVFDDRGRLFIAESAGGNLRRDDLEKELPNFIRMLEDVDGDGRFDKSTIFADKMTLPMGALWHEGALYVAAPPNIWRLEDTDDDGVADKREILVDQFGYSGNAASVHGCFKGPAGRIYWCDGRHGHEFRTPDGKITSQGKAARIFSCKADGSDVRVHCGGGMDNPVEVDFTAEGEMLGVANLFYRKRGDTLVHWMHGGVYPRFDQGQCIAEFASTGELLTEVNNYGHVAVSGMMRYRSDSLGAEMKDNIFVCEFNTHKVVRTALTRNGSTFTAKTEDFLVADSTDFHPTDVLEDADGSLLVIDTGGWFRIGCPTSQIAKPNILGAIYRVRRKDAVKIEDPRGLKIAFDEMKATELTSLLNDSRFVVREKAISALARRGAASLLALQSALKSSSVETRRNAIWALTRIGSNKAQAAIRLLLSDAIPSIRQAALYSVGITSDRAALKMLTARLLQDEPAVRREAATALGKIGDAAAVPALLEALISESDRVLEHAILYALIEIDDRDSVLKGLADNSPRIRRGALIALDQMPSGNLTQQQVAPLLDTEDFALQSAALEVINRREGWGASIVSLLGELLTAAEITPAQQKMLSGALIAFSKEEKIQALVASSLEDDKTSKSARLLLLGAIARSGLKPLPQSWANGLSVSLQATDSDLLRQAITAIDSVGDAAFNPRLAALSAETALPLDLRIAALGAASSHGQQLDPLAFQLLAAQINQDAAPMLRLAAARALGAAKLDHKDQLALADLVSASGPLEMSQLLAAFEKTNDADVGLRLVAALNRSSGADSLSSAAIERLLINYPAEVKKAADPLLARFQAATKEQRSRLDKLEKELIAGDLERGKAIFHSKKTSCVACHRIGEEGGRIGPDLSTIGERRNRRDLLEAILYPSSSLARGFESYTIATDDGVIHSGLITRETASEIFLRTPQQTEIRLLREIVEEMAPSPLSIMPAGLDKTMTNDELQNLLAYLRSLK